MTNICVPNQEEIYRHLSDENWPELLSFVWQNPQIVETDSIIKHAITTCEDVFFQKVENGNDLENHVGTFESFFVLHREQRYLLSEERFRIVTVSLVKLWRKKDLKEAYQRAQLFPTNQYCAEVIKEYESLIPKSFSHSQQGKIGVTKNTPKLNVDGRCTLFKSKQEKEFFEGGKDAFPMFIVYPNVALTSIVDFQAVKQGLSQKESDYFFRATVDCVVFDYNHELYRPKFFVELDSPYHDNSAQIEKDRMKDKILATAGQDLFRIRRRDYHNRGDFVRLIREMFENNQPA